MLHSRAAVQRLLYMFGGCTELWSNISAEAEVFAVRQTYGAKADYKSAGREPTDYVNSQLIVMWGWSPADGTFGTGTLQYLKWAKQRGVRIVCVDPRRTRTSRELADEHMFIRPSTDAAALIAMAYVIVSEGLHDQAYLDRHVLGFDEAHLPAGRARGRARIAPISSASPTACAKTPEWAAALTGVPAATIRRLAREFATAKPAALQCGYAPGRTALRRAVPPRRLRARRHHRQCGHPGRQHGHAATAPPGAHGIKRLRAGANPSTRAWPRRSSPTCWRAGRAGGYPADIKMVYSACGDLVNQAPTSTRSVAGARAASSSWSPTITSSRRPPATPTSCSPRPRSGSATTSTRRGAGAGHYVIFMQQAIAPMYECRNDMDICADLARRLGHRGLQRQDRARVAARADAKTPIDDFETFRERAWPGSPPPRTGGLRPRDPRSRAAPVHDAVGQDRDLLDGASPPIPTPTASAASRHPHVDPAADARDPRHPLQLCSPKSRARTHSTHDNQEILGARRPRRRVDAPRRRRRARHRRRAAVRVFNERGATILPAHVTERIAPGVVSIKEGAWFTPDAEGRDTRGCANVLTEDRAAPCGATTYNTCRVDIAPA